MVRRYLRLYIINIAKDVEKDTGLFDFLDDFQQCIVDFFGKGDERPEPAVQAGSPDHIAGVGGTVFRIRFPPGTGIVAGAFAAFGRVLRIISLPYVPMRCIVFGVVFLFSGHVSLVSYIIRMIITKQQSRELRYRCATAEYNQPCTRKYTGGPEGKVREIGKFKYIERGNELVYFEYDGDVAPLSKYNAEEFLSALADDSGFHLCGGVHVEDLPSEDANDHNDIGNAAAVAAEHITVEVPPQNDVHEVNVLVQVEAGEWVDADGNDPAGVDQGTADIPELLTEEEKKAAEKATEELPPPIDTAASIPPVEAAQSTGLETDTKPAPVKEDRWGEAIREVAMTAAAREAAKDCGIEGIPDTDTSVDIVRTCYTTPGFMNIYGECLQRVGNPRSLEEIAEALPAQRKWLFK